MDRAEFRHVTKTTLEPIVFSSVMCAVVNAPAGGCLYKMDIYGVVTAFSRNPLSWWPHGMVQLEASFLIIKIGQGFPRKKPLWREAVFWEVKFTNFKANWSNEKCNWSFFIFLSTSLQSFKWIEQFPVWFLAFPKNTVLIMVKPSWPVYLQNVLF